MNPEDGVQKTTLPLNQSPLPKSRSRFEIILILFGISAGLTGPFWFVFAFFLIPRIQMELEYLAYLNILGGLTFLALFLTLSFGYSFLLPAFREKSYFKSFCYLVIAIVVFTIPLSPFIYFKIVSFDEEKKYAELQQLYETNTKESQEYLDSFKGATFDDCASIKVFEDFKARSISKEMTSSSSESNIGFGYECNISFPEDAVYDLGTSYSITSYKNKFISQIQDLENNLKTDFDPMIYVDGKEFNGIGEIKKGTHKVSMVYFTGRLRMDGRYSNLKRAQILLTEWEISVVTAGQVEGTHNADKGKVVLRLQKPLTNAIIEM